MSARRRIDPDHAKRELRIMLEEAARDRGTVTYRDVAVRAFGGLVPARSRLIMDVLSDVDEETFSELGVVIASLVVRSDSGIPGDGYFRFLADRFTRDVTDPRGAWLAEAERVWAAYSVDGAR